MLETIVAELTPSNHHVAVALASLPEKIRGFGPVKHRSIAMLAAEEQALYEQFRTGAAPFLKAAE
jgi:indolepyruvate ferredoxin oxidoreductase